MPGRTNWPLGNADDLLFLGGGRAAQLGQLRLELLVGLVRWAVIVERLARIGCVGDLGKHFGGIWRLLGQLDVVVADAAIWKAPGLQMARKGEHGLREPEVGLGQRIGARAGQSGIL